MEEVVVANNTPNSKVRFSGIDLLRIIAILLICIFHANQTLRWMVDFSGINISNIVSVGVVPFGTIGNILFVICSSYFLVDSRKSRGEKAINILIDSSIISIGILIGFLIGGQELDPETIVHQIFPDVFRMNWFIPCYVVFYLLAPVVVAGLKHLSKKAHFLLIVLAVLTYGLLSLVYLMPLGSELLHFFYILAIVAFIKWHTPNIYEKKKLNLILFIGGIIFAYLLYFLFFYLARRNPYLEQVWIMNLLSPVLLLPLICLFNIFAKMNFQNKFISYLSTCSLFVYVIHENYLLRTITRVNFYNYCLSTYGEQLAIVYMLICGSFMFICGFLLAVIYKESIHRLTSKFSILMANLYAIAYNFIYNKIFKESSPSDN